MGPSKALNWDVSSACDPSLQESLLGSPQLHCSQPCKCRENGGGTTKEMPLKVACSGLEVLAEGPPGNSKVDLGAQIDGLNHSPFPS